MSVLRGLKLVVLSASRILGVNQIVLNSDWRQQHVLIVCWHGISIDDEHIWNPASYLEPMTFRARLEVLRSMRCNVLPLREALDRLGQGTLPPRSVVLTIDDGDSSVYLRAWPLLREFGFAATLYWTTYYSICPYAVFDPMLSYLLWKGRGRLLQLGEPTVRHCLETMADRVKVFQAIYEFSQTNAWTAERKESCLRDLAAALDVDYLEIKAKRILHLISPSEARAMVAEGLDLQLHTHRHRVSTDRRKFSAELADNARWIRETGARNPSHFCYPSGSFVREFGEWLNDDGIASATTCQLGFVGQDTDRYFLPRFLDHCRIGSAEFSGWISGVAAKMFRQQPMDEHSFR